MRRLFIACAVVSAVLFVPACGGGGGGGGGGQLALDLQSITVPGQPTVPESPFGTTIGGTTIQLNGTGFVAGCTVQFGSQQGVVQNVSSTQVTVVTPPGPEGFVTVTVTNPTGENSALSGTFQFVAPPTILSVLATTGPTTGENRAPIAGNETMQVTGINLKSNATITVNGVPVATAYVNTTTINFTVPPTANEAAVNVVVQNPEGLTSTLIRGLVYTQEFSLDRATDSLTPARANHLYRRAGFGATPAIVTQAIADGLAATVTNLMDYTNDPAVENTAFTLYSPRFPPDANINNRTNQDWWIHLLQKNPSPFQERLAWFLHDHFATSGRDFNSDFTWTLYNQINLFRRASMPTSDTLANGEAGLNYDWYRILVEVAKDRAMLDWLDGRLSRRNNHNENFARELWELFMLGEGVGYTEDDIKAAADAFTGFYWFRTTAGDPDPNNRELDIAYRLSRHDERQKTIFGVTGFFGYDSISPFLEGDPSAETDVRDTNGGVVALTLQQRPVESSRFICRKLAVFFLYDDVHDIVVDELASDLRAPGINQWNLKPIIRKILQSKAMYSSRAMKGKVKSPVEYVIGFLRTTQIDLHPTSIGQNARRIRDRLGFIGQVPLDPPDVNGWPSGTAWMAAQSQVERFNFLNAAVQELENVTTQIEPLLPPVARSAMTPAVLVDHFASILDVQLTGEARRQAIDYVTSELVGATVQPYAFDPTNDADIKNKTRGLIYIIGQYHDAHQD